MISLRIDVSKIDKKRLFKGEKGTYLDCVLIETPAAKYGKDWMIVESISKEEREAGHKGTIIGDGKTIGKKAPEPPEGVYQKQGLYDKPIDKEQIQDDTPTDTDDLPF